MLGLGLGITVVLPQTKAPLPWYNPSTGYSIPTVLPQCSYGKTAVLPRYYRGITAYESSITAVTLQKDTPSPRYYRNVHGEKPRYYGSSAVLPRLPRYYRGPYYRAAVYMTGNY